jgi:hypothetical protein
MISRGCTQMPTDGRLPPSLFPQIPRSVHLRGSTNSMASAAGVAPSHPHPHRLFLCPPVPLVAISPVPVNGRDVAWKDGLSIRMGTGWAQKGPKESPSPTLLVTGDQGWVERPPLADGDEAGLMPPRQRPPGRRIPAIPRPHRLSRLMGIRHTRAQRERPPRATGPVRPPPTVLPIGVVKEQCRRECCPARLPSTRSLVLRFVNSATYFIRLRLASWLWSQVCASMPLGRLL